MLRPATVLILVYALAPAADGAEVDYVRDIKPILAKNCYECHGAATQKAKLRLDTAAAALKGGTSGPAVTPAKSDDSLLIEAVTGAEGVTRMPLKRPPLAADQIQLLKDWIDQGAKAPADEAPQPATAAATKHWAFIAPVRAKEPEVKNKPWVRNPIDSFVLARLEAQGVQPSAEADRATLSRRVSLDLTGLPPSVAEVDAFLTDNRPDAYEQLVDRLLASPHYGERWARHWLDAARYADSNGFNIDAPRSIWHYRDWVIDALNKDLPFEQFTVQQMAGDMLPGATVEQKIATGFHRNTLINQEGGIDKEQFRVESVVDRVNTTGTVFLGITLGCAQCHDHKYDPFTQREYYQLFAFFNNSEEPTLPLASSEKVAQSEAVVAQLRLLEKELEEYQSNWLKSLSAEERGKIPPGITQILMLQVEQRDDKQKQTVAEFFKTRDIGLRERVATISELWKREPKFPTTMVVQERETPRETHVHIAGDFTRPGDRVTPAMPAVLHGPAQSGNLNRLDLARWLVDPANPLNARVSVNRMWQQYFGRGIVETENDFGTQGSPPTHPELLDWLATELVARSWSLKAIHRLIVTSATYRQSSTVRPELAAKDPYNKLLARQSRLRLDAEIIRDTALAAGGLLNPTIGGPSVFPPQPEGVMTLGQMRRDWTASAGADRYRRGMYTFFWRATPYPSLIVFDAPGAVEACTRRIRSNTPLQALTLLNDQAFVEFAQALAARVLKDVATSDSDRIRYAFRLCLAREPSTAEREKLGELLARMRTDLDKTPDDAKLLVSASNTPAADLKELAAWTQVARVLLNLDEFITRE